MDNAGKTPQEIYLETGVLTEEFFELYCYAAVCYFAEATGLEKENVSVVIGWDPRDKENLFTGAALRGLLRHEIQVYTIGIAPTPMVPFTTTYLHADFGIAVTASHNPADQNGIKIFCGYGGLKLMEKDEERLSEIFLSLKRQEVLHLPLLGRRVRKEEDSHNMYVSFCRSFLKKQPVTTLRHLMADNANGANSLLSKRVFSKQEGIVITSVNTYQKGIINNRCGVTYYDNTSVIPFSEVNDPDSAFSKVPLLRRVVKESEKMEGELLSGQGLIGGIIFDGDGDRLYWLEVNYQQKELLILSGDKIAANLLSDRSSGKTLFLVTTIESDNNLLSYAEKKGCKTTITPVGDKWLIIAMMKECISHLLQECEEDEGFSRRIAEQVEQCDTAVKLSALYKNIINRYQEPLETRGRELINRKFLGCESSGHVLFSRILKTGKRTFIPIFVGNALGIAAEFAKVTPLLLRKYGVERYHQRLSIPFEESRKQVRYLYYSRREKFRNGSSLYHALKEEIPSLVSSLLGEEYHAETVQITGDPHTLFFTIEKKGEEKPMLLYIRNSGTEEKTAFTCRSSEEKAENMLNLLERCISFAEPELRKKDHPYYRCGMELLSRIRDEEHTSFEFLQTVKTELSLERLQKEFFFGEHLLEIHNGKIMLTPKGHSFLS